MSRVSPAELSGILSPARHGAQQKSPSCCEGEGKMSKRHIRAKHSCAARKLQQRGGAKDAHDALRGTGGGGQAKARQCSASRSQAQARGAYEAEASRSIAPSSLAGRAEGEARAARERRAHGLFCLCVVRSRLRGHFVSRCDHTLSLKASSLAAVTKKSRTPVLRN